MAHECAVDTHARQSVRKNLDLFDRTMEPGYVDKALEELGEMKDRDGQGNAVPEIRRYKLQTYFRLFRMVTEAVDANYLPRMAHLLMKEKPRPEKAPRPIPEKVGSAYLYDYIQSGLRVLRFQIRVAAMEYIRSAYQGTPSPEERAELLSLAEGVDEEFLSFLKAWTLTDVSWAPDKNFKRLDKPSPEERLAEMTSCLRYMRFLEYARDPLYLKEDCASMNIAPPFPVGQDSIMIAGQSPDSIKEQESRRQYLIALHENRRKSAGVSLLREQEDRMQAARWNVFTRIESDKFMDRQGRRSLLQTANMLGMDADFRDNLRAACAGRDIDEAITRFKQTKDRKDLEAADALIGAFQGCRKELWGKDSCTFFQLERWLRLNHIAAKETAWPDGARVRLDLEEKMMANIWKTCGASRFRLQEAGWWLSAYGLKARAARVREECRRVLEMEKKDIEERLLLLDKDFSREALKKTNWRIDALTHHDYQRHKNIQEILDFKTASWLRLVFILEKRLAPFHERRKKEHLVFEAPDNAPEEDHDEKEQNFLYECHRDLLRDLEYKMESEYGKSRKTQQHFLKLAKEAGVGAAFLLRFKHRFSGSNLDGDIRQLKEKGEGSPEHIAKAIEEWMEDEKESCASLDKCLVKKLKLQFDLLEAMHKSGNRGTEGFEPSFQASVMEEIHTSIADDLEGFWALRDLAQYADGVPLQTAIEALFRQRLDRKEVIFLEKLARFEEEGQLDDLHAAFGAMDYVTRNWGTGKETPDSRRRKTEAYLNMLRMVYRFRPQELMEMQKKPVSHWGSQWNDELPPLRRMELTLEHMQRAAGSSFFSHIRYGYGREQAEMEEIRRLARSAGLEEQFLKEVEKRLAEKR